MRIVIIEDEGPAARRLSALIKENRPQAKIVASIDSVELAVEWLQTNTHPDIAFMDIQLADGLSFDIFEATPVKCPVIFTTAYDEYAIKAFKVNSIDYLLKPINSNDLSLAFDKFDTLKNQQPYFEGINELIKNFGKQQNYKSRFLVKQGQRLVPIDGDRIAYFYADEKVVFVVTHDNHKYIVDYTLDQLESSLNPMDYYRANRKIITSQKAIKDIFLSFNGKLKLYLTPDFAGTEEVFVSREKAAGFKSWMGT